MIGLLWFFLEKTPYGWVVKAGAHDSEMVRALGINLSRLRLFVFALGVALAAIAGVVMAPIWGVRPQVGVDAVVPAFLIIVLGGVGSLWGACWPGCGRARVCLTGATLEWSLLSMYCSSSPSSLPLALALGRKSVLDMSARRPLRARWRSSPAPAHVGSASSTRWWATAEGRTGRHRRDFDAGAVARHGQACTPWPATSPIPPPSSPSRRRGPALAR